MFLMLLSARFFGLSVLVVISLACSVSQVGSMRFSSDTKEVVNKKKVCCSRLSPYMAGCWTTRSKKGKQKK